MKGKICSLCIALLCLLASCSEEENSNEIVITPADYSVKGKVEKGPFIKGSTITLQPLDAKMNPLGTSYSGVIIDDEGSFDIGTVKLDAPYALLITDGFFYNEIYGRLSDSRITLQAIVDLKDNSTVNVNIFTHLAKERIKHLIAKGASFHDANKQAQKELLTNFGLQKYAETDVAQFSITSGTDEAAALLVVSAAMIKDRSEAQITEYLTQLSLDFTANGKFTDDQKEKYRKTSTVLEFSRIADNVKKRYSELGKEISVKDLAYYVDYDGNGIAGDELGDPNVPMELAFEQTELQVPKEGGTYTIKICANVPYSFTNPIWEWINPDIMNPLFNVKPIAYEKQSNVQEKELTIIVKPAESMLMKEEVINLYSMNGIIQSVLTIHQEGDLTKTKDILSMDGLNFLTTVYGQIGEAISYLHTIEGIYSKSYQNQSGTGSWTMFQQSHVSPTNNELSNAWAKCYAALRKVYEFDNGLKRVDVGGNFSYFLSYTASIRAALYYEMVVLWENMPYVDRVLDFDDMYKLTNSTPSLAFDKAGSLLNDRSFFADKKNNFSTVSDLLFASKDVPAALQAKMYLYLGEYAKALQLFEEVINSRYYQMESSRSAALSKDSKEMVYGLPLKLVFGSTPVLPTLSVLGLNDDYIPLITYTEVLLSAAECAKRLNDEPKANSYLNEVLTKKGVASSGDFTSDLKTVWQRELKGTGTYFAFLKRNKLALSELGFDSEAWLILPIPSQEINRCPLLKQNPGYW